MPSKKINSTTIGKAEKAFRDAFERLKKGRTERMPKGTRVSQNNVAKEAGCIPSALRKSRFPTLIAEIQRWVAEVISTAAPSPHKTLVDQRKRNRTLREKIEALKTERDNALSLLVEADAKILELMFENADLHKKRPTNVQLISGKSSKNRT